MVHDAVPAEEPDALHATKRHRTSRNSFDSASTACCMLLNEESSAMLQALAAEQASYGPELIAEYGETI